MTAELTDERLAELHGLCQRSADLRREVYIPLDKVGSIIAAFDELQAYRAKLETHVWVPRETLAFARNAVARLYGPEDLVKFDAMLAASDGNPP